MTNKYHWKWFYYHINKEAKCFYGGSVTIHLLRCYCN